MVTMIVDGQQLRNSLLSSKPNSRIAVQRHGEREGRRDVYRVGFGRMFCSLLGGNKNERWSLGTINKIAGNVRHWKGLEMIHEGDAPINGKRYALS
jgi:hypothetical protein